MMSPLLYFLGLCTLLATTLAQGILLPNVTGRYLVGTTEIEVLDTTTMRDIMLSFFYPATRRGSYPLAPVFPPLSAQAIEQLFGLPPHTAELLYSQAHASAPLHKGDFPILLFSTGYGSPRLLYTAAASDLASEGYIVVLIDHPQDSPIIEYPGGRLVLFAPPDFPSQDDAIPFVLRRVSDARFILDQLTTNASITAQIPGLANRKLRTARVGILGHSLGGATAGATMLADDRFIAGANLDGSMIGDVVAQGLARPFLLMLAEGHGLATDSSLSDFYAHLRGYKRALRVLGTQHQSFADTVVLVQMLAALGIVLPPGVAATGTIDGTRMLKLQTAYVTAFFDQFLRDGEGRLLERPSSMYPEVLFEQ